MHAYSPSKIGDGMCILSVDAGAAKYYISDYTIALIQYLRRVPERDMFILLAYCNSTCVVWCQGAKSFLMAKHGLFQLTLITISSYRSVITERGDGITIDWVLVGSCSVTYLDPVVHFLLRGGRRPTRRGGSMYSRHRPLPWPHLKD